MRYRSDREDVTKSHLTRRRLLQLSGGLAVSEVCLPFLPASAQSNSQTLIMIVQPEAPTLASYMNTSSPVGQLATKIYEGLLEYDFNLKQLPGLAESWKISEDGKTIAFALRKDVKFHDATSFTSADVQFSIMEVLKKYHPRGITTFREISAISTPDPHTAVFHLNKPSPYILMALSGYESPMLPKHLLAGEDIRDNQYVNKPIGTGPFKFVEWVRGRYMLLAANKEYWKAGEPRLEKIVARFISDAQTRTAALQTGEADYGALNAISLSDAHDLKSPSDLKITTNGYQFLSPIVQLDFNVTKKPFDDQKVRQAIAFSIDREFIAENLWFGYGRPATGPISSNFKTNGIYTNNVKLFQRPDGVAVANELLDSAGYRKDSNGVRFKIVHDVMPFNAELRRLGEYIKQQLALIGIEATLRLEDVPTWLRRIYTNYDFELTSNWLFTQADPAIGVQRLYSSKNIQPGLVFVNASRWSSSQVDSVLEDAAGEINADRRAALYHEFQRLVVEASPSVWLIESDYVTAYRANLQNVVSSPLGCFSSFAPIHKGRT